MRIADQSVSKFFIGCTGLAVVALPSLPAFAQQSQTTEYRYDALGRLVKVEVAGGQADGTARDYTYDAAGNRVNVTATGSSNTSNGGDGGGDGNSGAGNGGSGAGGGQQSAPSTSRPSFNGIFSVQRKL